MKRESRITVILVLVIVTSLITLIPNTSIAVDKPEKPKELICAESEIMKWVAGAWACSTDNDSGGDITAVNAGTGLTGGATSGDVTLSVQDFYSDSMNFFAGQNAGSNNTGEENTFVGADAGISNEIGNNNTFVGYGAGYTFTGINATHPLFHDNTFVGRRSGYKTDRGTTNTFVGAQSGFSNTRGSQNTFLGWQAGILNTEGIRNTFVGWRAGYYNKIRSYNTYLGTSAGETNIGKENTYVGALAGYGDLPVTLIEGNYNTFIGRSAGHFNNEGSANVFIGYKAGFNETGSDKLYISNSDTTTPLIYGDFAATPVPKLTINGDLDVTGLFTELSDRRLKDVHGRFTRGLDAIEQLRTVSFNFKKDNALNLPTDREDVGVIAQDVREVIPEAVVEREDGYLSVNNGPIIWTMLNAIKELKAENDILRKELHDLKESMGKSTM